MILRNFTIALAIDRNKSQGDEEEGININK